MKWITRCRSLAARGEDEVGQKNIKSLFVFCLRFLLYNDFYNLDLGGFTIFSSSSSTHRGLSYCAWWGAHGEVQWQTHWKYLDIVSTWSADSSYKSGGLCNLAQCPPRRSWGGQLRHSQAAEELKKETGARISGLIGPLIIYIHADIFCIL